MPYTERKGTDFVLFADVGGTQTAVGALRNTELTIDGESIDASHRDNYGWRTKLHGMNEWSVSAGAVVLMQDTSPWGFDPAVEALRAAQENRSPIGIEVLYPDGSNHAGNAIVTQWQVSGPYDGMLEGSISLEGAGQLTWNLNAAV